MKSYLELQPHVHKWIIHMHQQARRGRLALICGAGISIDAGVPAWKKLVENIARDVGNIPEDSIIFFGSDDSPTYLTQIAYERHMRARSPKTKLNKLLANEDWARIVHTAIYKKCDDSMEAILKVHPYLQQLATLAFKCQQVITFNFDSLLSDAMQEHATKIARAGGEQLVLPDISVKAGFIQKPGATTIFHINGLLPRNLQRKRSEQLVFTENAFADAMISANTMEFNNILFNLSNYTNLIIGHSLNDASLKNLLRGSRNRTPAQLNYYLYWLSDDAGLAEDVMKDIFDVNLEVYNLITIFATTADITEILGLINESETNFPTALRRIGVTQIRYLYYIIGPVASGKTSVLHHLRYFQTYEEWLDSVPPSMYKSHEKLAGDDRERIEEWVINQLDKKNRLMNHSRTGFYFMDRAPLDALVFSASEEERKSKALNLSKCFGAGNELINAQLRFIYAEGKILEERNISRGRLPDQGGDAEYLESQTKDLDELYSPENKYDTTTKSSGEVAREIAISALLEDHKEKELKAILERQVNEN